MTHEKRHENPADPALSSPCPMPRWLREASNGRETKEMMGRVDGMVTYKQRQTETNRGRQKENQKEMIGYPAFKSKNKKKIKNKRQKNMKLKGLRGQQTKKRISGSTS
jgi:hypothetical protein